jgi:uncharacterized protein (DUF1330 family)
VPRPAVERRMKTENELVTWLFWCRRLLEDGQVRVVKGVVPTFRELAAAYPSAKVRRDFFSSLEYQKNRPGAGENLGDVVNEMSDPGEE